MAIPNHQLSEGPITFIDERSILGFGIAGGCCFLWATKSFLLKESGPLGSGPWRLQLRAQFYNAGSSTLQ